MRGEAVDRRHLFLGMLCLLAGGSVYATVQPLGVAFLPAGPSVYGFVSVRFTPLSGPASTLAVRTTNRCR